MRSSSAWSHRWTAVLGLVGCGICAYLSLYECRVIRSVWDPIFGGQSSKAVLDSQISRRLPVPDAVLGFAAYAAETALALGSADEQRRSAAWPALLLAAVADALALTGVVQVLVQGVVIRAFCACCLVVAGISFLNAWLERDDTAVALTRLRDALNARGRLGRLLWGEAV